MSEIEGRLAEAREELRVRQHEACTENRRGLRAYRHYWGKVCRIREEWLGLCEAMKICTHKNCGHYVGLFLLKERMHDKYRDVRLHGLRLRAKYRELFFEALSARWRVCRLKRRLRNSKEVEFMRRNVKCPLVDEGSKDIHRRKRFAIITASERGYFTRYAGINAKPEVQS